MGKLKLVMDENDVKKMVKKWYDARDAWSYAPIQTGMGQHGIPDRVGCLPIMVTPEMVGKHIGLFVAVEAKRPGRRGEDRAGATPAQRDSLVAACEKAGIGLLCDGAEDLAMLDEVVLSIECGYSTASDVLKRRIRE